MITYDDFKKVEIKAGKVLSAEKIPNTDKLLKLSVDFGEMAETADVAGNKSMLKPASRQIVSGISGFFPDLSHSRRQNMYVRDKSRAAHYKRIPIERHALCRFR